jgi:hypothetical protein
MKKYEKHIFVSQEIPDSQLQVNLSDTDPIGITFRFSNDHGLFILHESDFIRFEQCIESFRKQIELGISIQDFDIGDIVWYKENGNWQTYEILDAEEQKFVIRNIHKKIKVAIHELFPHKFGFLLLKGVKHVPKFKIGEQVVYKDKTYTIIRLGFDDSWGDRFYYTIENISKPLIFEEQLSKNTHFQQNT